MDKPKFEKLPVSAERKPGQPDPNSADYQLWRRFLAGETAAFQTLMTDYFRTLFRYGARFSKDKEFIKDCIQDLFLYLWEHRSALREDVAIKPYLMVSLRRYMHRNLPDTTFSDEYMDEKVKPFDANFSVEEQYIQEETMVIRIRQMNQFMAMLPPRQKEVIYLKFFQELERDQIAEIMGIVPQTVSNLIQLAIKQLRQCANVDLIVLVWFFYKFNQFFTLLSV